MARDGKMNLIDLPVGFHGNHPAYNKWIENKLLMHTNGRLTYDAILQVQKEAVVEIEKAYKAWINQGSMPSANMNEHFKALLKKTKNEH